MVAFETIKDTVSLERIKFMFSRYTLDDSIGFGIEVGNAWVAFERNGSIYTLYYDNDKLKYVTIVPT